MHLLLSLPEVLQSSVISVWLTIVDVARMDSAMCSRLHRQDFLHAAYQTGAVLSYPRRAFGWHQKSDLANAWIFSKNISVDGFHPSPIILKRNMERKIYLQQHGSAIQWIHCFDTNMTISFNLVIALEVAQYCPRLTRFAGDESVPSYVLPILLPRCPLLTDLIYSGYWGASEFTALTEHCTKVKRLHISCTCLGSRHDSLIDLVRRNPVLIDVSILLEGSIDGFLRECAICCGGLINLAVQGKEVMLDTIIFLLKHCRRLPCLHIVSNRMVPVLEPAQLVASVSMRTLKLAGVLVKCCELERLLSICPGLTSLAITSCEGQMLSHAKLHVGKLCSRLQHLTIRSNSIFTINAMLMEIAIYCGDLRTLVIPRSRFVRCEALAALAAVCPLLEKVDVTACASVTDNFLFALARNCRRLRSLCMDHCTAITDAGVDAVMTNCPDLMPSRLGVNGCEHVSPWEGIEGDM
jgi:hypothetical protein